MEPKQETLDELVRRIREVVEPLRIVLFGSAARGEMGPHSDLDVLVVMPDGTHCRQVLERIYLNLFGLGVAKDIIVATASDIERHRDNWSFVYYDALREGKELYRAAA
jgi:predicted nucleotidyltransferase